MAGNKDRLTHMPNDLFPSSVGVTTFHRRLNLEYSTV